MYYIFSEIHAILLYLVLIICGLLTISSFIKRKNHLAKEIRKHQKQIKRTHHLYRKKFGYLKNLEKTIETRINKGGITMEKKYISTLIFVGIILSFSQFAFAQGGGYMLQFDGVDECVEVVSGQPNFDVLNLTSVGQIECWFNPDDRNDQWAGPINKGNGVGGEAKDFVYGMNFKNSEGEDGEDGWMYAGVGDASSKMSAITTSQKGFEIGKWHHIIYQWWTSFGNIKKHKFIIDGRADPDSSRTIDAAIREDFPLFIARITDDGNDTSNYFKGRLENIRIWNTIQSEYHVRETMCLNTCNGPVAEFQFNEGRGATTYDSQNSLYGHLINLESADWLRSTAPIGDEGGPYYGTTPNISISESLDLYLAFRDGVGANAVLFAVENNEEPVGSILPDGFDFLFPRYWNLQFGSTDGDNTYDALIRLFYAHLSGVINESLTGPNRLSVFRRDNALDATWEEVPNLTINTTDDYIQFHINSTGTDFGEFALGRAEGPNSITLSTFTAIYANGSSMLQWITQSESENLGWNIYRSETDFENAFQINAHLIEGAGTTTEPTEYKYIDQYNIISGKTYNYWLESRDYSGNTETFGPISLTIPQQNEDNPDAPVILKNLCNYPNPFSSSTEIEFGLNKPADVEISFYNTKGQKVDSISRKHYSDKIFRTIWNAENLGAGIYLYVIKVNNNIYRGKTILIK